MSRRRAAGLRLVAATIAAGWAALAWAADSACGTGARAYSGQPVRTPADPHRAFMMVSSYRLEPYTDAFLDNVLADLARHRVSGIVFSSLGAITEFLHSHGDARDEIELDRDIYRRAQQFGAALWLQVRAYDNQLAVGGAAPRTVSAEELLRSPPALQAYRQRLDQEFAAYNESFADACVVIVFEEAGIYHAAEGGGTFWSSQAQQVAQPSAAYDQLFAQRFTGLFVESYRRIKAANPRCSVGIHLGHSVFENRPVLQDAFASLRRQGAAPDFVFYDLSLKAQPDFATYARRLGERADFIEHSLQLPAMHLVQLNTMNNFQHGLGGTPSQDEIDRMVQLDRDIGFSGIGFYTKNAVPTTHFDNHPLAPNPVGQATVYESSKDRWDYGMLKLYELQGVNFARLFDLAVGMSIGSSWRIEAQNQKTGRWDLLGVVGAAAVARRMPAPPLAVLRTLDADAYLAPGGGLSLRLSGTRPGTTRLWLLPSLPSASYRSLDSLGAELGRSGRIGGAIAYAEAALPASGATLHLCPGAVSN